MYPDGASRFEMYEDDGRTNAYRQGARALTRFECEADARRVVVRIGEPEGDGSVVPVGRHYLLRLRMDAPRSVTVEGHAGLVRSAGWRMDAASLVVVRVPTDARGATITLSR
jgi:hypothetical protein